MSKEVKLPSLGEDAGNVATVSFWQIDVGDEIEEGEDLVELVTDKATFNVPCPFAGTLKEIKLEEGEEVKVGDVLGILE